MERSDVEFEAIGSHSSSMLHALDSPASRKKNVLIETRIRCECWNWMLISSCVSYHEFHLTGTYIPTDGSSHLLPIQGPGTCKVMPLQFAETMGAVPRAAPCSNFCTSIDGQHGLYAGRRRWHEALTSGPVDPTPAGGELSMQPATCELFLEPVDTGHFDGGQPRIEAMGRCGEQDMRHCDPSHCVWYSRPNQLGQPVNLVPRTQYSAFDCTSTRQA